MPKNQTDLPEMTGPGVESTPGDPHLEQLAERYAEARDARMEATKPEVAAKELLVNALHERSDKLPRDQKTGALIYRNVESGIDITLTPSKEKLKVKIKGEGTEGEEV